MTTAKTQGAPPRRRRRPWTAAEKTACLRAFAASGQSATAFCRERGVPRATLTLWRRTASAPPSSAPPADAPRFAQVGVVAPRAPQQILAGAPPAPVGLTLALRTPDGLEAVVTGLDATTAVAVLRGVITTRRSGAA